MQKTSHNGWLLIGIIALFCALETWAYHSFGKHAQTEVPRYGLNIQEVRQYMAAHPNLVVVDVRTQHEFSGSHMPGAINMPLFLLYSQAASLPNDRPILLTDIASARARQACKLLRRLRPDIAEMYYVNGRLLSLPVAGVTADISSP